MRPSNSKIGALITVGAAVSLTACGGSDNTVSPGAVGGAPGAGGSQGGATQVAGAIGTAGSVTTGGSPNAGGANGVGGAATGGTRAAGATTSNTGTSTTGGTKATGGAPATGGSKTTGGAPATGGASATGGGTSTGSVFSQCRFHFGTIDTIAKSAGTSMISQLDFFTPGWMQGNFAGSGVCSESAAGGALAGLVPVVVTYIAANYVKTNHALCDCNVSGCSGGDLCTYGSQYITQDWSSILAEYTSNSTGYAACLGGRPIIFDMEPDWYQYTGSSETQPWSVATAGTNITALVNALKASLPQARFSMDISPWIANNGSAWYPSMNMGQFTFINTSGGSTNANSTLIRTTNAMTWAGVNTVTGKPILADTGYGASGVSAGEDPNWNVAANINARMTDGVISICQYNPTTAWGTEIAGIRSQLNTPRYCP